MLFGSNQNCIACLPGDSKTTVLASGIKSHHRLRIFSQANQRECIWFCDVITQRLKGRCNHQCYHPLVNQIKYLLRIDTFLSSFQAHQIARQAWDKKAGKCTVFKINLNIKKNFEIANFFSDVLFIPPAYLYTAITTCRLWLLVLKKDVYNLQLRCWFTHSLGEK